MWCVWHQCWWIGTWITGCTDILLSHPFPLNEAHSHLIPIWSSFYSILQRVSFEEIQAFSKLLWDSWEHQECLIRVVGCCSVAQSCLALCKPMGCSPPGSSVRGISQARILQWLRNSSCFSNTKGFLKETQASTQYWHPYISALLFWGL